jgi:putative membrane protein
MSVAGADGGTLRRTEPIGLLVRAIGSLRQIIPALIAAVFFLRDDTGWLAVALPAIVAILGANVFAVWLQWRRFTYRVGEQDIRVESGLLSRAARSVPYERIQDVSLEQGALARIFGLVEVRFETGAGGKDELKLAYLRQAEGERLRELVRERRDGEPVSATEAPVAAEPEGRVLFAIGPGRLVTFGLFEFSLAVVAVIGGAVQQFDFLLPFDPWDFDAWQERLAGPGAWLAGLGPIAQVVGGVIAALSLIAIGFATGLVRTVLRDWGFTLERTAKGFRRRRGLITRTDVVMPAHRVQALQFTTRFIRRRFGWHGLKFVSLAQDAGASSHDVAPFARWDELEPVARAAGFEPPSEALDWRRASRKYRIDQAVLGGAVTLLAAIVAVVALSATGAASPLLALIPLAATIFIVASQAFLWRFERHALSGRQILSRRGWLAPQTDLASRLKLQSVEIAQGPIARRRGYATLHLGLAGGKLAIEGIPVERARELRHAVLDSIAATDFSKLG